MNTFLTPSIIAREALMLLESNMVAGMLMDRSYETEFRGTEKVGDTITIRRRDTGSTVEYNGSTVTAQTLTETGITLTLEKHFDYTIAVSTSDMTLDLQSFSDQILAPAMISIAEKVDQYALTKLKDLPNVAGPSELAVGALPASIGDMALIRRKLNELKVPTRGRIQIVSPEYEAALLSVDSFVEADKSGTTAALREASIGRLLGIDTYMDQNVDSTTHTTGAGGDDSAGGTVNGNHSAGATSIALLSMGNDATFTAGDILLIAGYGGVVVAANATMDASGNGTVTIVEPLRDDVATTTVVTIHTTDDTWEMHGAVFVPRAFAFASVPLELPNGAAMADRISDRGLSLRVVYDYDRNLKSDVISIDTLVGVRMVDGRLGAQILKA